MYSNEEKGVVSINSDTGSGTAVNNVRNETVYLKSSEPLKQLDGVLASSYRS